MKIVKILRLTLDNFKGQRHLVLDLNGQSASIYGSNGVGKTTIYDGLTWLLFGKNSQGETKFEIKPHDKEGAVLDPKAITAVEAVLDVAGETRSLRRTYYEKWSSRRGGGEVFDGHSSDFFVDGVPVKKYAFEEAVAAIVDEGLFRVLTNVTWFCEGMHWRDRRALLFQLGQVEDDKAMMAGREEFAPLLEAMGRLGLEEYRKKLQAERKGLTGVRDDVPIRLDECRKRLEALEGENFDALGQERAALTARRDAVQGDLSRLSHGALLEGKRNDLAAVRLELTALERENEAHRRYQSATMPDLGELEANLRHSEADFHKQQERLAQTKQETERIEAEIERLRERWKARNAMTFTGEDCPTCHRPLEGALLAEAAENFQVQKQAALDQIVADSREKKTAKGRCLDYAKQLETYITQDTLRLEQMRSELAAAREQSHTVTDLPDYESRRAALEERLVCISEEVRDLERDSASAGAELRKALAELDGQIRTLDERLAKEGALREVQDRMEQLRRQARDAAARLEALDKLADLCEAFVRYKTSRIEESVNSRFDRVRWRLFEEQVNGGLAECCEATVDGTGYSGGLNKGARVNAGIEVIDVLSRHYGIRVPLVVDDAEGVTELRKMDSQVIRLVVSEKDTALRMEKEEKV